MVPLKTLDESVVLCDGVVVAEVSSMSGATILASARFLGVGDFSSPDCAARLQTVQPLHLSHHLSKLLCRKEDPLPSGLGG